jgi:hypothetical protein
MIAADCCTRLPVVVSAAKDYIPKGKFLDDTGLGFRTYITPPNTSKAIACIIVRGFDWYSQGSTFTTFGDMRRPTTIGHRLLTFLLHPVEFPSLFPTCFMESTLPSK